MEAHTIRLFAAHLQTIADNAYALPLDDHDAKHLQEMADALKQAAQPTPVVRVSFTVATELDSADLLEMVQLWCEDTACPAEQEEADTTWQADRAERHWQAAAETVCCEEVSDSLSPCF